MSLNAATIEFLLGKGLTGEDLLVVARSLESDQPKQDTAAERRREWDRNRKREQRLSGGKSGGNPPDPSPNEIDILTPTREKNPEPKGSSKKFPAPSGVAEQIWADFLKSPKRKKAGMSDTAYSGICNNLNALAEHGYPPGKMIALAVERGWTTVKLEWVENDERTNSLGRNQPSGGLRATADFVFGSSH